MKLNWLKNVDIFEISYVNRPAIDKRFIAIKMMDYKSIIPFKKTKSLPEGTTWDAGVEVKKSEVKDLKIMCTWYDEKDAENKGAYKLPHHEQGKGYPVVWNGVKAAMGALMGSRGGVILPDSDRKGVYDHLVKHYKQFDKEVPEFKKLDELDKSFVDKIANKIKSKLGLVETKIGRVLSKSNETKLSNAADSIVKAGETIQTVLESVTKNIKKEDSKMEEKDVKKIVEDAIEEKIGTFKTDIEAKLEELLSTKNDDDSDDSDDDEDNDDSNDSNDDSDDDSDKDSDDDDSDDDSDFDDDDDKDKGKKSKKKDVSKKKSKDNDLVTKISNIVEKKFEEVKSEVDSIKKELKIKPKSDKKKEKNKKAEDDDKEADFTGAFGIKL